MNIISNRDQVSVDVLDITLSLMSCTNRQSGLERNQSSIASSYHFMFAFFSTTGAKFLQNRRRRTTIIAAGSNVCYH